MNKKPPRRSIVSSFSAFAGPAAPAESAAPPSAEAAPEQKAEFSVTRLSGRPPARVGAGIIGATQRTLTDIREERDRLLAQVEAGGLVEVDPESVDPSPLPDRLPDDDPTAFEALKRSLAEEGQKVPVELRRHPDQPGRYQLVYGHRRWRAARELGLRLKAIVGELDDRAMALAQGLENAARQDLSWIEKALFAWRMEAAGIRARDIRAALQVDDPELARFRSVCRALGPELIALIGRAPKAGRPRWTELAAAASAAPARLDALRERLQAEGASTSDQRFARALASFASAASPTGRRTLALEGPGGGRLAKASIGPSEITIKIEKGGDGFLVFLEAALPDLAARYRAQGEGQ
jgi:ParB family chromosome partitioning protein